MIYFHLPLTARALSCHVARLLLGMIFSENRHPLFGIML